MCSDPCGAPSADEEVTAASLVIMYADHPGDVTATSRLSEQATMKITALYGNLVNQILRVISLNTRNDLF